MIRNIMQEHGQWSYCIAELFRTTYRVDTEIFIFLPHYLLQKYENKKVVGKYREVGWDSKRYNNIMNQLLLS